MVGRLLEADYKRIQNYGVQGEAWATLFIVGYDVMF
jgi:hypothetical protein